MRSHNEGTIFQRKRGRDKGVFVSAVTMRDGRRVSRISHSRDDAKAELAELIRLRDARAPITERIRLSDYLQRWVSDGTRHMAPATRRKHAGIIRTHLAPALGHHRLSELSPGDVERAIGDILAGPQTQRHIRATLRRALADAERSGLVRRNAATLARPAHLSSRERTILDATQARHLIEATRDTRCGPLWTILLTTGLRISEALGLAWSAVDFAAPSITVRHQLAREEGKWVRRKPKTEKGRRTIPLTPLGVEALRAQRRQQDADLGTTPRPIDGLVFTSPTGAPIHATNLLPVLRTALADAGLPRVTIHDLRHSCATVLLQAGTPLPVVSRILGHSTLRITMDTYIGAIPELQREAADRMQEALG